MALGSMIMGIVAVVVGLPGCLGCCCGIFTALALICGIVAVILGFMSNKIPGSEGMAMTGIICGFVGIAFGLIGIVMVRFEPLLEHRPRRAGRLAAGTGAAIPAVTFEGGKVGFAVQETKLIWGLAINVPWISG